MKKWAAILLFVLCAVCVSAVFGETSGDYEYAVLEDGTAEITKYNGNAGEVAIPEKMDGYIVSAIGNYAFQNHDSLTEVTIPDSVTAVGENPFYYCKSLTGINISPDHPTLATIDGVLFSKLDKRLVWYPMSFTATSYSIPQGILVIGNHAFDSCFSLTDVTIPDSVISIGEWAFGFCSSLINATIPDSVTSIGNWAFGFCSNLTDVTISDSVTFIGVNPFINCESLNRVTISSENSTLAVIDGVLFSKPDKRLVWYPMYSTATSYSIPQNTLIIGDDAFYSCSNLTNLTIPDGVTSIGDGTFCGCFSLTNVMIPNGVTSIGDWAFDQCTSLTNVTIPDSVISIGYSAFRWCLSLNGVTIPKSVIFIGEDAFSGCINLTLTVEHDSYVAQYCKNNNLNFTYSDSLDWLNN